MCGRYLLLQHHYRAVLQKLGLVPAAAFASRFNIAPGTPVVAVRVAPRSEALEAVPLQWGLLPARDTGARGQAPLTNARAESLTEKPAFREAARWRRCILPASGFYEWERASRPPRPWLFHRPDDRALALAGLWEPSIDSNGPVLGTCAVVTTEANETLRPIHHRMPILLTAESVRLWLDQNVTDPRDLAPLLRPQPPRFIVAVPVSSRVNDARNDDETCIQIADTKKAADDGSSQLSLEI